MSTYAELSRDGAGPLVPIEHESEEEEIPFDFEPEIATPESVVIVLPAPVEVEVESKPVVELPEVGCTNKEIHPHDGLCINCRQTDHAHDQTPVSESTSEPEPVAEHADTAYVEVPNLTHLRIKHILAIASATQFLEIFASFEDQIEDTIEPLVGLLNKVIMTREVTQLESHAAEVDAWRERVSRYLSLAVAFVEHGKSSRFILHKSKGIAEFDREAHKRSMTSGYVALQVRLEGLLDDVDFRINNCKKFSDQEKAGFKNYGGRVAGRPQ